MKPGIIPEHLIQLAWVVEQTTYKAVHGKETSETYEHFRRYYGSSLQHIRTALIAAALLEDQELFDRIKLEVTLEFTNLRKPRTRVIRPLGSKQANTAAVLAALRTP